jgi:hypothetical protein
MGMTAWSGIWRLQKRWAAFLLPIAVSGAGLVVLSTRVTAGVLPAEGSAPGLHVSTAMGAPGQLVGFEVALSTGGAAIAGTQNDLVFDPLNAPVAADVHGRPSCSVNSAIGKDGSTFAFEPAGCVGSRCTGIRALIFSVQDSAPIADGSVLYTCAVAIAAQALPGSYALTLSKLVLSDPLGNPIGGAVATDGAIIVTVPTATPTPTPVPTATRAAVSIVVGNGTGAPSTQASFSVVLEAPTAQVAGAAVGVGFGPDTPVEAAADGRPECSVNPAIDKGATAFAFAPAGCTPGLSCTGVSAVVIAADNTTPIPSGSTLFTCTAAITGGTKPGVYPLSCFAPQAADPSANALPVTCTNGIITVKAACPGDCNGDHQVTVAEILAGVNIALGGDPVSSCPAFDADGNGKVTINELLAGVLAALDGCPAN